MEGAVGVFDAPEVGAKIIIKPFHKSPYLPLMVF
jgi:hypothetical protein